MGKQQDAVDFIVGQIKTEIMHLLNETADEFDAKDMSIVERSTYNEFTGVFGKKVLDMKVVVE